MLNIELVVVIVEDGKGSKVLNHAKSLGVTDGLIYYGKGTVKNSFLELLGLSEATKEIVWMPVEKTNTKKILTDISKTFAFERPGKGIAMSLPISQVLDQEGKLRQIKEKGEIIPMFQLIVVQTELGNAETVVDVAREVGQTGATIVKARGCRKGEETETIFGMEIEPQKEMILMLSSMAKVATVIETVKSKMGDEVVIFTMDVNQVEGI